MSNHIQNELFDIFFGKLNITRTLSVLLNAQNSEEYVLVQTLSVMCSTCVTFTMTEFGLTPFANYPVIIFPYKKMQDKQLEALTNMIEHLETDLSLFKSGNLMGGGFSITLFTRNRYYIDASKVLASFFLLVKRMHEKQNKSEQTVQTYNLIVQRIMCNTGINKNQVKRARDIIINNT